jgi:hypothetical protein
MLFAPAGEVGGRADVAVAAVAAAAGEYPIGQRQIAANSSAGRAQPARRVPSIRDEELAATPGLFVCHEPGELGPARIRNGADQTKVGQHPRHMQVRDYEPVVGLDQRVGYLV